MVLDVYLTNHTIASTPLLLNCMSLVLTMVTSNTGTHTLSK